MLLSPLRFILIYMEKPPYWVVHPKCRPIFPGRFQPSIFGANELNFCVRDGNRWDLIAINTDY